MADTPAEQLLLAFGIDLSPLKEAVKGAASILGTLNDAAAIADEKTKSAAAQAKEEAQATKAKADAAVSAAKQAVATEAAKAAAAKATAAEIGAQVAQQRLATEQAKAGVAAAAQKKAESQAETAELQKQRALQQQLTAEINKQAAEIRKKRLEEASERKESGGEARGEGARGGAGGLIEKLTGGLLGRGIAGSVAGGVLAGEGIAAVIEGAGSALERFLEKLRDVSTESGNLVMLQKVFEGLATGAGLNATETMNRLSEATEGLVSKMTLLKVATTALRSPYKIGIDQVEQLAHDVTVLAEASGHTAEQGLTSMNQALERGRPITLGLITGVAGLRDVMRDIPPTLNPVERSTLMWQRALKMLHDQAESLGDLPDTFEKMSTRFHVASENAMLAFGQGFNESEGVKAFYKAVDAMASRLGGIEAVARKVGDGVGYAFEALSPLLTETVPVLESIYDLFDKLGTLVSSGVQSAFASLTSTNDSLTDSFQRQHPIIDSLGKALIEIGGQIRLLANDIELIVAASDKLARMNPVARMFIKTKPESRSWEDIAKEWASKQEQVSHQTTESEQNFEQAGGTATQQAALNEMRRQRLDEINQDQAARIAAAKKDFAEKKINAETLAALEKKYIAEAATDRKKVADEVLQKELENINQLYDAKKKHVEEEKKPYGGLVPIDLVNKEKQIEEERQKAIKAAQEESKRQARGIVPPPGDTSPNMSERRRKEQDQLQAQTAQNKAEYDLEMNAIQARKQLEEGAYRDGEETLSEHYRAQISIIKDSLDARLKMIDENFAAQKTMLGQRLKDGLIQQDDYETELRTMARKTGDQRILAEKQTAQQLFQLRNQERQDDIKQQQEHVKTQSQNVQAEIQSMMARNTQGMQGGGISVDDYYKKQLDYINQIKDAKVSEAWQLLALQKDTQANRENALKTVDAAINAAEKQVEDLLDKVAQLRTSAIEKAFQPQQQYLQQQLEYGKTAYEQGMGPAPVDQLQQLMQNLQQYRQSLENEANRQIQESLNSGVALNRDLWAQILEKIEQTYQTQQKYNDELNKMSDILQPVAGMFQQIGKSISSIWTGKSMSNVGSVISQAAGGWEQIQDQVQQAARAFGFGKRAEQIQVPKDKATLELEKRAKDILDPLKASSDDLRGNWQKLHSIAGQLVGDFQTLHEILTGQVSPTAPTPTETGQAGGTGQPTSATPQQQSAGGGAAPGNGTEPSAIEKKFDSFVQGITAAVSALSGFVSTITKATSAASGALGGGIAGEGLGQSIGSLIPGVGGLVGGIAGAAGGAMIGAITGNKNNQVAENIKHATEEFNNIMAEYNQNTDNLEIAIKQMQDLIAQVAEMQANSKKGGQQYEQLIQQYTQELQSLEDQQIKIIQNMQNSLAILMTPVQGQSYLNDFKQILDQYKQFVGAAQNAQQLAEANDYLSLSLQKLTSGYTQNLLSDEQTAVQDALNLNQLYQQRLQFINQLNQQIQGVLQQGSLTRQQTMAQKKGQQIEQIQAQANLQLDQMNQEIAVAQMKVNAESQVFHLATTRIGLETQLLQLQGAQTQYQMAQIQALQQLVNTLQSGNYNFTTLQALLDALGYPAAGSTAATNTTQYGGNYSGGVPAPTPTPPNPVLPGSDVVNASKNRPTGLTMTTNSQLTMEQIAQMFASAYSDRGSIGFANYRGQNL